MFSSSSNMLKLCGFDDYKSNAFLLADALERVTRAFKFNKLQLHVAMRASSFPFIVRIHTLQKSAERIQRCIFEATQKITMKAISIES